MYSPDGKKCWGVYALNFGGVLVILVDINSLLLLKI
jgi:hypothetical protein